LLRVVPLPKAATGRKNTSSGGGMPPPDEQPKTFLIKEKLSTIRPAVQGVRTGRISDILNRGHASPALLIASIVRQGKAIFCNERK
jgi:hypothetical protein